MLNVETIVYFNNIMVKVNESVREPLLPYTADHEEHNVYQLIHEISRAVRVSQQPSRYT